MSLWLWRKAAKVQFYIVIPVIGLPLTRLPGASLCRCAEEMLPVEKVDTPDCGTVEDVAKFLQVPTNRIVKTMYYQADEQLVIALVRGDRRINEIKLQGLLGCNELTLAENAALEVHGQKVGYLGPVGVDGVKIVADAEVPLMFNVIVGANDGERHLLNVNYQRG